MVAQQPEMEWKPGMWAETDTGWKFLIRYIECGSLVGQDEQGRWGGGAIGVCRPISSPMHEWKVGEWAEFTEHQSDGDRQITFRVSGIIYADPTWLRSATNPQQNYRANDCRPVPEPEEKPQPAMEWKPKAGDEAQFRFQDGTFGAPFRIGYVSEDKICPEDTGSWLPLDRCRPVPPPEEKPFQGEHWKRLAGSKPGDKSHDIIMAILDLRDRELERLEKEANRVKAG